MKTLNTNFIFSKEIDLYGDNFTLEEIEQWYLEESEAYANLGNKNSSDYLYKYHNLNKLNGFNYLKKDCKFDNAMGFGSAYGLEFLPIIEKIEKITILEPSENLKSNKIGNIIPTYLKPNINGSIGFDDATFDLITCFGVLHHIPNVSFIVSELIRVLMPGGYFLIKEPISTMGDWQFPRPGLTKNERGIPVKFLDNIFKKSNVEIVSKTFIDSLFVYKILSKLFKIEMNTRTYVKFDKFISRLFSWNLHYHRISNFQKIAPGAVFYVIKKLPE
jgi:SAM-dependent methyltransferase